MNTCYISFFQIVILILLIIGIIGNTVVLTRRVSRKEKKRRTIIFMIVNLLMFALFFIFYCSHSTYYKYNDWYIINHNINSIEKKYGSFDLGQINDGQAGIAAYYIYTDNGPIMPDHLRHYYYMEYDESGIVYKVYNACQAGG